MKRLIICSLMVFPLLFSACEKLLDTRLDTNLTPDQVFVNYDRIKQFGMGVYNYVPDGYNRIGNAFLAAATDEAEHTLVTSSIQDFNLGFWSPFSNPEASYTEFYRGIRSANLFLEKTPNFRQIIARDTFTTEGLTIYNDQVQDLAWLRGEVRFLRAYLYFELIKRYGAVPLVTRTLELNEGSDIPRTSFQEVAKFIADECDAIKDSVNIDWVPPRDNQSGRVTKGTVLALKSRTLLYAASPLNNPTNDLQKWRDAAKAARDVIAMNKYSLFNNYQNLFLTPNSYRSNEVIFARRYGNTNSVERQNYPIGTPGGQSGTTPSQNLVDAYEKLPGWDPANPYALRDPRLNASVVVNNSNWNGRTIELWAGGRDGKGVERASKTGYYLKKFLSNPLDLVNNQATIHAWILFRYAEILLNYAEAMNEAYGPDDPATYGMSARQAVNMVRARPGVAMPPLVALTQSEMREKIRHERQVELAFEEHRFWDVRRWMIAESTLGAPLMGVEITKTESGAFIYNPFEVEKRVFDPQKMYLYPIPQAEINKSNGVITQNPNW